MKYIRTKDGRIIDVSTYNDAESTKAIQNLILGNEKYIYLYQGVEIDKYADTIDELCDEFIVISDNCEKPIISALPFDELQLYARGRTKYAICYGAIWTDKGLIYVAKMNDKGELELL